MASSETRRKVIFLVALATLVTGAAAMALLGPGEELGAGSSASGTANLHLSAREAHREPERGAQLRAAALSARRFLSAYLRYQEGRLRDVDRKALLAYSTAELGHQLVLAPVRVPPGSRPPHQFVARIAGIQAGLFDGDPAFLATLVIAGSSGTHLLSTSLLERGGAWVVAGIGP